MTRTHFEDTDATYRASIYDEGQYSLWPAFAAVPAGWHFVHEEHSCEACLKFIADMDRHAAEDSKAFLAVLEG